ncbi:hypothetical protein BWI17_14130 [Betaproteobacteria bacterium GR16-43]|nr:hypothetical protein BWI17_14130 [Betaproteobacteria bacterium GR16-43]
MATIHVLDDGSPDRASVIALLASKGHSIVDAPPSSGAERRLERLTQFYTALSRTNSAIVRIAEPAALYQEICDICVEYGGVKLAFIAIAHGDHAEPVAAAGPGQRFLDGLDIPLDPTRPEGSGPIATAVREGRDYISNDFLGDPKTHPWRERALAIGTRSVAAIPFRCEGRIAGAISLHVGERDFFDEPLVALLDEMAADLSFSLDGVRRRLAHEAAEAEILRLNAELEKRVTERTAALEAANEELHAYDYSISHDLSAPLRHISGFGSALLQDTQLDEEAREHVQRMLAACDRMKRLIDDLLQLSTLARVELKRTVVDMSLIATAVCEALRARSPGRVIEVRVEPGMKAWADPGLARIALENLIGNAWKFTSKVPVARIEIGPTVLGGRAGFRIKDNGAGFAPEGAERLFTPFTRLHSESDFEGTGVGLATVKRIVNRHEGTIEAEGRRGEGATFRFTLEP